MNWLDFLFPKKCVSCGRFGNYFCKNCIKLLNFIEEPVCPVCEKNAIFGKTHPRCESALSLDGLISIVIYKNPIKKAIYQLKYKFTKDLANDLVNILFTSKNTILPNFSDPFLVPIPLHWFRRNWRGFNQTEILGLLISKRLKTRFYPDALKKETPTREQVTLKGKERQKNVANIFEADPNVRGKEILLFDDVWTTGATLRSACGQLKRKGAKTVWGLTLSR